MKKKIKINLNSLCWIFLSNNIKVVAAAAPVEDWELQSLVIARCYKRLLQQFTFYPSHNKELSINLELDEAIAINEYFAATSTQYNILLRNQIEPQFPISKPLLTNEI